MVRSGERIIRKWTSVEILIPQIGSHTHIFAKIYFLRNFLELENLRKLRYRVHLLFFNFIIHINYLCVFWVWDSSSLWLFSINFGNQFSSLYQKNRRPGWCTLLYLTTSEVSRSHGCLDPIRIIVLKTISQSKQSNTE